ncbi:YceD family protein [Streptococcus cameli]
MVQFHIYDLQKNPEGIVFDEKLDLTAELLSRNPEILDLSSLTALGRVRYEAGMYFLEYQLSYDITMASSRSMEPVSWTESYPVLELFVADEVTLKEKDMVDAEMVLLIENETIILDESVADNILLNLPAKVLTEAEEQEEAMPSGENWTVMTESQYQASLQEKQEEASPFAGLQGLFDEE